MRKNFVLFILSLFVLSCVTPVVECECALDAGGSDLYAVTVEVDLPDVADPKSTFTEKELDSINDLNIFIYHNGKLLVDYSGYFTDVSDLMLAFPCDRNDFNIYMVGNVGKVEAPYEESKIVGMRYAVDDYDVFRRMGFPVANVFRNHKKGTLAVFKLKRLVGQYNLTMRNSATDAVYRVKDVRLMNCALDVYPFDTEGKATSFTRSGAYGDSPEGDSLTEEDIDDLNDGRPVTLYFIENIQGELLPGNEDRKKKIPSSLEAKYEGISDKCTYIEITSDVSTPAADYVDGKYRFYLGQNETTDFTIRRNTLYNITLDFTQNMVREEEWRIEVSEPDIKTFTMSKSDVHVVRGTSDYIIMSGPKVKVNEELSGEGSDDLNWILEDILIDGVECQKLTFMTECEIVGMYSWGDDYTRLSMNKDIVLETVEQYNGRPLLKRTVTAYVHNKIFPVFLRVGGNPTDTPYQIDALSDAPVRFNFNLSASLKAALGKNSSVGDYYTSPSSMGYSEDGYRCCSAVFSSLSDSGQKDVYFREMNVMISGVNNECSKATGFYMGDGGETYWGPGSERCPRKFSDLTTDDEIDFATSHFCGVSGCVRYTIYGGGTPVFVMSPKSRTCNTVYTTGTSNSLTYDISHYNSGDYLPFYIANGGLRYSYPVTILNEEAKYLDDSARVSIMFEMSGPGRDVFYPNGVRWGSETEMSPSRIHKFGFSAGLTRQFFGNIHTWQLYQDYECEFYMTVNGCTVWPGCSNLDSGFVLK